MTWYRPFRNTDPPRLLALWHACGLGRGAAEGFGCDAFEVLLFSQPYFEPEGLVVAGEGDEVVGFVHAGFAPDAEGASLARSTGVVCAVMVHPDHRRRGIGRELVSRAVAYLRERGAGTVYAGSAPSCDPFYIGLYGGARTAGFLESDPHAGPFLAACGFESAGSHTIYARHLEHSRDPVSFRLVTVRRRTRLDIGPEPTNPSWWWATRFGRLDTVRFELVPRKGGPPLAGISVVGLDLYVQKWNSRAVGLMDVFVPDAERRQGYAQTLMLEVCRRLRDELVNYVEMHVAEPNTAATSLLTSCAFEKVDRGIVYRLAE